ncbi:MAG: response regulator [Acidobacteriota bacterium]
MPPITASPNTVILLAQPERDDRELYLAYLRQRHFLAVAVSMAADALTLAPQVDLIVTESLLPGSLDGVALVARLKNAQRTRAIPVIMLTSCAWPSERDRAYAAGCDVFLAKPCVPDLFVTEIRRLLARHHRAAPATRAS